MKTFAAIPFVALAILSSVIGCAGENADGASPAQSESAQTSSPFTMDSFTCTLHGGIYFDGQTLSVSGLQGPNPSMTAPMIGNAKPVKWTWNQNVLTFTAYEGSYSAQIVISADDVGGLGYPTESVEGFAIQSSNHNAGAGRTTPATCK